MNLADETELGNVLLTAETTLLKMPLRGKAFFDSIEQFNQVALLGFGVSVVKWLECSEVTRW